MFSNLSNLATPRTCTFEGFKALFPTLKNGLLRERNKNYRLALFDDRAELWLYRTNVLTYYPTNLVVITHGGWDTPTTRQFLRRYSYFDHLALSTPTTIVPGPRTYVDRPRRDFTTYKRVPRTPPQMKGMNRQFDPTQPYYLRNLDRDLTKREYANRYHYTESFELVPVPYTGPERFLGEPT